MTNEQREALEGFLKADGERHYAGELTVWQSGFGPPQLRAGSVPVATFGYAADAQASAAASRIAPAIRALLGELEVLREFVGLFEPFDGFAMDAGKDPSGVERANALLAKVREARGAQSPAEPVAWRILDADGEWFYYEIRPFDSDEWQPLYADALKELAALTSRNRQLTEALGGVIGYAQEAVDRYYADRRGDGEDHAKRKAAMSKARKALADALPAQGQKEGKS